MAAGQHPASYRDPSGFIFRHNKVLYRQVNKVFSEEYDQFLSSGFYQNLVDKGLLVPHQTLDHNFNQDSMWHATLQPEAVRTISYPYEWCFDMLKDAALLTLEIAKTALEKGFVLKDATPYNIQFHQGRLIFIDTLSFESMKEPRPWIAYRQFCENFLAPLALMHYLQVPLHPLQLAYSEGIPLQIADKMLPWKSKLNLGCYLHLHLHARYNDKKKQTAPKNATFSKTKLKNIFEHLEATIRSFRLNHKDIWSDYYDEATLRQDYVPQKKSIIENWVTDTPEIKTAIDVGANEGFFSELLAARNIYTISVDFDHYSINRLYRKIKKQQLKNIVPLTMDLAKPSPAIGVNNEERDAFTVRVQSDLVMALAVIHHLAIGKNIPFRSIAGFLRKMGKYLIIEFVPKDDEKIREMLAQKKDIYTWYTEEHFLKDFGELYRIREVKDMQPSGRKLYFMQQHEQ